VDHLKVETAKEAKTKSFLNHLTSVTGKIAVIEMNGECRQ
jgi:hypothetical protein